MKKAFNILKPCLAYWLIFIIWYILSFFEVFGFSGGNALIAQEDIFLIVMFSISNILIGYFEKTKNVLWGMLLLELQLIIGTVTSMITYPHHEKETVFEFILSCGNIIYSAAHTSHSIIWAIFTIILPIPAAAIGIGLSKLNEQKNTNPFKRW